MSEGGLIDKWALDEKRRDRAHTLRRLYQTLATQLFDQYEPTRSRSDRKSREFFVRLEEWLSRFSEQKYSWAAFRSIEYLLFAGQHEYDELYRCALQHVMQPWLVTKGEIDIFGEHAQEKLDEHLSACWPCPVTDSLRINGFLHVSQMKGQDIRPDWHSLAEIGDTDRIRTYVASRKIRYLVLLEDFVGGGGQFLDALAYAAKVFPGPILAIPLIICAPGNEKIANRLVDFEKAGADVTYKPILVLGHDCLVGKQVNSAEPKLFSSLRKAMKDGYKAMKRDLPGEEFGWKRTGSLVVMYSNCPNNTPPIFHCTTPTWRPVFPRSSRV